MLPLLIVNAPVELNVESSVAVSAPVTATVPVTPSVEPFHVKFELSDRTVYLAGLFPMYNEEIAIYEAKGTEAFWNTPGFHPYDPTRASIAGK